MGDESYSLIRFILLFASMIGWTPVLCDTIISSTEFACFLLNKQLLRSNFSNNQMKLLRDVDREIETERDRIEVDIRDMQMQRAQLCLQR